MKTICAPNALQCQIAESMNAMQALADSPLGMIAGPALLAFGAVMLVKVVAIISTR